MYSNKSPILYKVGKNSRADHGFTHKSYFARDCLELRVISSALSHRPFEACSRALLRCSLATKSIRLSCRPLLYGGIGKYFSHQATEIFLQFRVMADSATVFLPIERKWLTRG